MEWKNIKEEIIRVKNIMQELFTEYKIEKKNEKKECWEHYRQFVTNNEARKIYNLILKNKKGIYRLIKIIEIDER